MRLIVFVALSSALLAACGPRPVANSTPTPAPTSTPISAIAERIQKDTNVSFNTYSKEWPVNWQWVDPDGRYAPTGHDIKTGVLAVTIPKGKNLTDQLRNAPRYVKAITGDFEIETRVAFPASENFQGAGLLLYKDDLTYVRLLRAYGGPGGGGSGLLLDVWKNGEHKTITTTADLQTDAPEVDLRFVRNGSHVIAYWRVDENSEWRGVGEIDLEIPDTILTGLVACNMARETTARFNYIKLFPRKNK